jgi:CheY-like chemotaxis protein
VSVDSKDDISDWVSEGDVRSFKNSEIRESQAFEDGDKIISDISPLLLESRVLIVDDSAMNRKMMFVSLQTRFDEILQAEDGVQAVAVVTTRLGTEALPQVILMDFMMPHMNGPAATAEIRAMGYTGVIVGVTGNTLQNDIDEFLRNGVNRVLPKPLDVDTLEMVLRG